MYPGIYRFYEIDHYNRFTKKQYMPNVEPYHVNRHFELTNGIFGHIRSQKEDLKRPNAQDPR